MGWEVGKKLRRRRVLERIGDSEEEKKALGHRINSNMDVLKRNKLIITGVSTEINSNMDVLKRFDMSRLKLLLGD